MGRFFTLSAGRVLAKEAIARASVLPNLRKKNAIWRWSSFGGLLALIFCTCVALDAQSEAERSFKMVMIKKNVFYARAGAQRFDRAFADLLLYAGDRVRIGKQSQLTLQRG